MSVEKNESIPTFSSIFDEYLDLDIDESHHDFPFIDKIMASYAKQASELQLLQLVEDYSKQQYSQPSHPLVIKMFSMLADFQKSPKRRKIQLQIDSFGKNAEPKDDLILLMIDDLRQQYALSAHLVILDPSVEPRKIIGSGFFSAHAQEARELPHYERLYSDIIEILNHDESDNRRILIIVRQVEHYTMLDYDKISKQCLILDAANDIRQFNLLKLKDKTPMIEKMIYVKPFELPAAPEKQMPAKVLGLQKDTFNCAAYALDHMYVAATIEDLHDILQDTLQPDPEKPNVFSVNWTDFPAIFVRNAISPTFIGKYKEKHLGMDESLFSEQGLDKNIRKFSSRATELLEQHDEQSIEELIRPTPIHTSFKF